MRAAFGRCLSLFALVRRCFGAWSQFSCCALVGGPLLTSRSAGWSFTSHLPSASLPQGQGLTLPGVPGPPPFGGARGRLLGVGDGYPRCTGASALGDSCVSQRLVGGWRLSSHLLRQRWCSVDEWFWHWLGCVGSSFGRVWPRLVFGICVHLASSRVGPLCCLGQG